jgi:CDP-4-dehydro-6-deoxyglucose reductase, E3
MSFQVSVLPSNRSFTVTEDEPILTAGIRQGVAMPYGCKDGACGSCKCKMLEGKVVHGQHQQKALSEEEEAKGYILTCCAKPQSDIVLKSRQVTSADAFPIKRMPSRVISLEKKSHDVIALKLQLPASDTLQYKAGQYIEFILRDGARRSYSMASAPHIAADSKTLELHIRHMPGGKFTDHVFGEMKEKEIQRIEGPFGSFYLREDSEKPMILLASGTGFALSKPSSSTCSIKASNDLWFCTGAGAGRRTCTCMTGCWRMWRRCQICATYPWFQTLCLRTLGLVAPGLYTKPLCLIFRI